MSGQNRHVNVAASDKDAGKDPLLKAPDIPHVKLEPLNFACTLNSNPRCAFLPSDTYLKVHHDSGEPVNISPGLQPLRPTAVSERARLAPCITAVYQQPLAGNPVVYSAIEGYSSVTKEENPFQDESIDMDFEMRWLWIIYKMALCLACTRKSGDTAAHQRDRVHTPLSNAEVKLLVQQFHIMTVMIWCCLVPGRLFKKIPGPDNDAMPDNMISISVTDYAEMRKRAYKGHKKHKGDSTVDTTVASEVLLHQNGDAIVTSSRTDLPVGRNLKRNRGIVRQQARIAEAVAAAATRKASGCGDDDDDEDYDPSDDPADDEDDPDELVDEKTEKASKKEITLSDFSVTSTISYEGLKNRLREIYTVDIVAGRTNNDCLRRALLVMQEWRFICNLVRQSHTPLPINVFSCVSMLCWFHLLFSPSFDFCRFTCTLQQSLPLIEAQCANDKHKWHAEWGKSGIVNARLSDEFESSIHGIREDVKKKNRMVFSSQYAVLQPSLSGVKPKANTQFRIPFHGLTLHAFISVVKDTEYHEFISKQVSKTHKEAVSEYSKQAFKTHKEAVVELLQLADLKAWSATSPPDAQNERTSVSANSTVGFQCWNALRKADVLPPDWSYSVMHHLLFLQCSLQPRDLKRRNNATKTHTIGNKSGGASHEPLPYEQWISDRRTLYKIITQLCNRYPLLSVVFNSPLFCRYGMHSLLVNQRAVLEYSLPQTDLRLSAYALGQLPDDPMFVELATCIINFSFCEFGVRNFGVLEKYFHTSVCSESDTHVCLDVSPQRRFSIRDSVTGVRLISLDPNSPLARRPMYAVNHLVFVAEDVGRRDKRTMSETLFVAISLLLCRTREIAFGIFRAFLRNFKKRPRLDVTPAMMQLAMDYLQGCDLHSCLGLAELSDAKTQTRLLFSEDDLVLCDKSVTPEEFVAQRNRTLTRVIKHNRVVHTFQTTGVNSPMDILRQYNRLTERYIAGLRELCTRPVKFFVPGDDVHVTLSSTLNHARDFCETFDPDGDILDKIDSLNRSIPTPSHNHIVFSYAKEDTLFHKFDVIFGDTKVASLSDKMSLFFHDLYVEWKSLVESKSTLRFPGILKDDVINKVVGSGYFYLDKWTNPAYNSEHLHLRGEVCIKTRQFVFARGTEKDKSAQAILISSYCARAEEVRKRLQSVQQQQQQPPSAFLAPGIHRYPQAQRPRIQRIPT